MPVQCPGCKQYMFPVDIKGVQVDYCKMGCQSIWLDAAEDRELKEKFTWSWGLNKIIHHYKKRPIREILAEEKRLCPRCNDYLEQMEFPPGMDLYLDICTQCKGIFFDKGELKRYLFLLKEQDKYENLDLYSTDRFQTKCTHITDVLTRIYFLSRWIGF